MGTKLKTKMQDKTVPSSARKGQTMTEEERAEKFYQILKPCLKRRRTGRFETTYGDKTILGLYRTVKRLIGKFEAVDLKEEA